MINLLVLLGAILFGFGITLALYPAFGWRASEGWKFADASPSGASLVAYRLLGLLAAGGGLGLWYLAWVN